MYSLEDQPQQPQPMAAGQPPPPPATNPDPAMAPQPQQVQTQPADPTQLVAQATEEVIMEQMSVNPEFDAILKKNTKPFFRKEAKTPPEEQIVKFVSNMVKTRGDGAAQQVGATSPNFEEWTPQQQKALIEMVVQEIFVPETQLLNGASGGGQAAAAPGGGAPGGGAPGQQGGGNPHGVPPGPPGHAGGPGGPGGAP